MAEGRAIILASLFVLIVAGLTVTITARVLPQHWRQRYWAGIVIDAALVVGSLLIAAVPVARAARLIYRYLVGLQE